MSIMYRSFMPIGQGGFAVEQFMEDEAKPSDYTNGKKKTVIFDCGSETKINEKQYIIEDRIKQALQQDENGTKHRIEKVFISHLHKDHINGLPELLRNNNVLQMYLPYLTQSEQVITLMLLYKDLNNVNGTIFQNLIAGKGLYGNQIETRVFYVSSEKDDEMSDDNRGIKIIASGQNVNEEKETDGKNNQWVFIPFTYNDEQRAKRFEEILDKYSIGENIQQKILNTKFWEDDETRRILQSAYKEISKDINQTNMVVYSGLKDSIKSTDNCCIIDSDRVKMNFGEEFNRQNYVFYKNGEGCLYMGDFCAKQENAWEELKETYKNVWNQVGVFTVPHHGSKHSFNSQLSDIKAMYIINAGSNNRYRHPHREVLQSLADNWCRVFLVNEFDNSGVEFSVVYSL